MGLARRVTDSVRVVSVYDDAIDWSETPRLDYVETRTPSLVKAIPGREAELVWFTVAPLDADLAAHTRTLETPHRELLAFQFAVRATSTDVGLEWKADGGRQIVVRQSMNALPDSIIQEIGAVALKLGDLTSGEGRRFGR